MVPAVPILLPLTLNVMTPLLATSTSMPWLPWLLPPAPAMIVLFVAVKLTVPLLASAWIAMVRLPWKVEPDTVPVIVTPVMAVANRKPMLPDTVLLFRIVEFVRLKAVSVPVVFSTRTLSSMAPLTIEFVMAFEPNRLSKMTLPSRFGVLVPLTPATVEYSIVKFVTLVPRMPKFWFVPLTVMRRSVTLRALFR